MSERDELIAGLRAMARYEHSDVTQAADAADLLERDGAEIARLHEAMKRQAASAIALANATKAVSGHELDRARQMRAESQPEMIESERAANARLTEELDAARAALAEAQRDAGRYRWLVNAGSENSPIARAQAVYHLWNGEDGTDGFTRALDAAIAKEQSHASE